MQSRINQNNPYNSIILNDNVHNNKVLCGKRLFKPSFFTRKDIRNFRWWKEIRRGYIHCYVSKPHPNDLSSREIVFKCTIPKGTRYWYDEYYGEYAARKIRFVEEMYNLA